MFPRSIDDAPTLKFLARAALFFAVCTMSVFALFLFGVLPAGVDPALGEDYSLLASAMHAPTLFHIAHLFDALTWLGLMAFWLAFALLTLQRAPARGTLLISIAAAMALGMAGGFIRGMGVSAIAERYPTASAADQQSARFMFHGLLMVSIGLMNVGSLLSGVGYAVAASVARKIAQFPRWLAVVLALLAVLELSKQLFQLTTGIDIGEMMLLQTPIELVLMFTLAWRFWRPTVVPTAELHSVPAR